MISFGGRRLSEQPIHNRSGVLLVLQALEELGVARGGPATVRREAFFEELTHAPRCITTPAWPSSYGRSS